MRKNKSFFSTALYMVIGFEVLRTVVAALQLIPLFISSITPAAISSSIFGACMLIQFIILILSMMNAAGGEKSSPVLVSAVVFVLSLLSILLNVIDPVHSVLMTAVAFILYFNYKRGSINSDSDKDETKD